LLGELRILTTFGVGDEEKYDMESLNKDLFQEAVRVIKKNNADFNFTNNFTKAKYTDPIDILIRDYLNIVNSPDMSQAEK